MQYVRWQNWMKNQTAHALLFAPRSAAELCAALAADVLPDPVRSVGKSKSWSALVTTTGSLVSLEHMSAVLAFAPDAVPPSITVQTGITVRALTEYLYARGFYLPCAPMYREISVGGVLATGSHGFNRSGGGIEGAVLSLKLVDAQGVVHELGPADGDTFKAACVSLGALGVVIEACLRIEPAETFLVDELLVPTEQVIARIDDLVTSYENLQIFWFPPSRAMCLRVSNRSGERTQPVSRLKRAIERTPNSVHYALGRLVQPLIARHLPALVPAILRLGERVVAKGQSFVGQPVHVLHNIEASPPVWVMSFSLPLPRLAEAWRVFTEVHRHIERSCPGFVLGFPVYARLIGPSEAFMAPSNGRRTCMLEICAVPGMSHTFTFFRTLEAAMRAFPDVRQHWGKLVMEPRGAARRFPEHARFSAVQKRLDPKGRFTNDFVRAAFLAPL